MHRQRQKGFIACRLTRVVGRGRVELSLWLPARWARAGVAVQLRTSAGRWHGPWRVAHLGSWTNRAPNEPVEVRAHVTPRPACAPRRLWAGQGRTAVELEVTARPNV